MKRLVLAGGGHAHVEVLRSFGTTPMQGLEIVLVTPVADAPYSGMLPGLIAGHYAWRDCHIDLAALARFAGAQLVPTRVIAINPGDRQIMCADRRVLAYDALSLDVGSAPPIRGIDGAVEHGVCVKPVDSFLEVWNALVLEARDRPLRVAVVGGGAGELWFAFRHVAAQARAQRGIVHEVRDRRALVARRDADPRERRDHHDAAERRAQREQREQHGLGE